MAAPLKSAKQTVNLATTGPKVSRIRRDPPPPKLKEISIEERNERDRQMAIIGIILFALALFAIGLGIMQVTGWQPRQIIVRV